MENPLFRKEKSLFLFVTAFLLATGASAGSPIHRLKEISLANNHLSENFLLSRKYSKSLKREDTLISQVIKNEEGNTSRYIHSEKNSDLIIAIPDAIRGKYKIRFFDGENDFLFEIKQLGDSLLILEKYNFLHAGLFQYELYKDNALVERNTFVIKKD